MSDIYFSILDIGKTALKHMSSAQEHINADDSDGAIIELVNALVEITDLPPADVKPVVRGKWIWDRRKGLYYCSACGTVSSRVDQEGEYIFCPNFCHYCGADMRGETAIREDGDE